MPLNNHNNIELVSTTTKVPVPFVVVLGKEAAPLTEAASSKSIFSAPQDPTRTSR